MDVTALGTAAVGAIVGIGSTWLAMRRDSRETRTQAITEAGKTIDLLKEQTELMRQQGESREGEWRRLEQTWHEREARLEKRIEGGRGRLPTARPHGDVHGALRQRSGLRQLQPWRAPTPPRRAAVGPRIADA